MTSHGFASITRTATEAGRPKTITTDRAGGSTSLFDLTLSYQRTGTQQPGVFLTPGEEKSLRRELEQILRAKVERDLL